METIKLSPEELENLNSINEGYASILTSLGRIELEKLSLEKQRQNLTLQFEKLQAKEQDMAAILTKKYGDGNINLDSGEFTKLG
jgi:di/tripeptidase